MNQVIKSSCLEYTRLSESGVLEYDVIKMAENQVTKSSCTEYIPITLLYEMGRLKV